MGLNQIPNRATAQPLLLNSAGPLLFSETIWKLRVRVVQEGVPSVLCYFRVSTTGRLR